MLLPETDAAGAAVCAERILGVLERFTADGVEGLRASAGVAPFERGQNGERLLAAAGAALRQAQEEGGGRVALAGTAGAAEYVRGDAALALMAALSERDAWTAAHSRAVGNLAATLAQKLGLSADIHFGVIPKADRTNDVLIMFEPINAATKTRRKASKNNRRR